MMITFLFKCESVLAFRVMDNLVERREINFEPQNSRKQCGISELVPTVRLKLDLKVGTHEQYIYIFLFIQFIYLLFIYVFLEQNA